MYAVSHLIKPLVLPASFVAAGMLWCLLLLLRRAGKRAAVVVLMLVFSVYYLAATWPAATLLVSGLEQKIPAAGPLSKYDSINAIVILSGNVTFGPSGRGELNGASWRRLWRGVEIYSELDGKIPIIFSGGGAPSGKTTGSGTLALKRAVQLGVPENHFWLENASRTTRESGLAVKHILGQHFPQKQDHRVILVTSAWHMPRAVAVFNRLDMQTLPVPCDYRSHPLRLKVQSFIPTYEAFSTSSVAIHEWIGMAVYWLSATR